MTTTGAETTVYTGELGARAIVCACVAGAALAAGELVQPLHINGPEARAVIETAIALAGILAAIGFGMVLRRARSPRLLVLVAALGTGVLAELVSSVPSALSDARAAGSLSAVTVGLDVLAAAGLAAVALAPAGSGARPDRRAISLAGLVAVAGLAGLAGAGADETGRRQGLSAITSHPAVGIAACVTAVLLVVSALAFARSRRSSRRQPALFAGASFLLGGAALQYMVLPIEPGRWITPRELLCLAGYAAFLLAAGREVQVLAREDAAAAVAAERERIARDLHDGLAQDLAFIVAHGQRLGVGLGPDHPLSIAAHRALAASRGVIRDLAASDAPSTELALQVVADELATRYAVAIDVGIDEGSAKRAAEDLRPAEREQVVRIAREAIVNAVRHGGASRIDVRLQRRGAELKLCVSDDGAGISDEAINRVAALGANGGFGLPTMRARADAIGGRLTARRRLRGGTDLEVLVPSAADGVRHRGGRVRTGVRRTRRMVSTMTMTAVSLAMLASISFGAMHLRAHGVRANHLSAAHASHAVRRAGD
jgi:signal transduction histidine kinase